MSNNTAFEIFKQGGVIAYPTEAVFGLGCDPDNDNAIKKLLEIKQRSPKKGLILLASNYSQLLPYIDESQFSNEVKEKILSYWPDGVTQILPKSASISPLLSGEFDTIAVRVTSQPDVVALCELTHKPIVSTSANLSGKEPAKTCLTIDPELKEKIDYVVEGETLGYAQPSKIINAITGELIRQ